MPPDRLITVAHRIAAFRATDPRGARRTDAATGLIGKIPEPRTRVAFIAGLEAC